MASDTVTVRLESDDDTDEIAIPTELLDVLGEEGDTAPGIVGDVAMLGLAQQVHGIVHHGQGQESEALEDAEAVVMEHFEERFGQTFAEVTGHGH